MDLSIEFTFLKKQYQLDQRAAKLSESYFNEWIELNKVLTHYLTSNYSKRIQILDAILIILEQSDASSIELFTAIQYNLHNFTDFIAEEYLKKLYDFPNNSFPDEI